MKLTFSDKAALMIIIILSAGLVIQSQQGKSLAEIAAVLVGA